VVDLGFEGQKFVLVFFRVVSILWLLPLFQSTSVSVVYKAGVSLIIAFLLFEPVAVPDLRGDAFLLLLAVAKEILLGLSIGFFVRVLFSMVSAAGEVISMQAGLSFARSMDPTLAVQTTVIEQFQSLLATMIFLGIDGHHILLAGIAASLKQVPPGTAIMRPMLSQYMIEAAGGIFAASLKICAPVVATLFLVELSLGILARMIPQVNVFIEGASIKILTSLAMLALSLNLIVPVIAGVFKGLDNEMLKIVKCVAGG
jgi:flagellar biosynthetic protein FliR